MESLARLVLALCDLVEAECAAARLRLRDLFASAALFLAAGGALILGVRYLCGALVALLERFLGPAGADLAAGLAALALAASLFRAGRRVVR